MSRRCFTELLDQAAFGDFDSNVFRGDVVFLSEEARMSGNLRLCSEYTDSLMESIGILPSGRRQTGYNFSHAVIHDNPTKVRQ